MSARAAPSGISAVVDPSGEIVAAAGVAERAALAVEVVPGPALYPPFLRFGGLLGPAALAGATILLVIRRKPRPCRNTRPVWARSDRALVFPVIGGWH